MLDAYALIYRAYYALIRAPRITSKGMNTSAIFGFCNTLDEILRKENPTHIAVCFDPTGGHTFRHEMYAGYKAQRDKQPEDITIAVPYIKEILSAYNIAVIEKEGYEADDLIGTIAAMAQGEGYLTYMMTPDKDYCQLVTDRVLMYRPALGGKGFEIRGPKEVCQRYGISSPRQVIDLLALEGDAADNIPGCPGVGEKTASKLIAQWGSVENMLANTSALKGALQKKIVDNADNILFSKELVTIKTDVPMGDFRVDSLVRMPEDVDKLLDIYRRLEFRMFISRLKEGGQPQAAAPQPQVASMGSLFDLPAEQPLFATAQSSGAQYREVKDEAEAARLVAQAAASRAVGLELYSVGEEAMRADIRGMAVSTAAGEAWYVDLGESERGKAMRAIVAPLFSSEVATIVCSDVKRSMLLLGRMGILFGAKYFDTSVAHYLIEPEMKHGLALLTQKYLDYQMMEAPAKGSMEAAVTMSKRICERADLALRIMPMLDKELGSGELKKLLMEIELPLIKVLADMEWTGVRIDSAELAELSRRYSARLEEMENRAYELAGVRFNIGSPMQVGEVLFEKLKIDTKAKRTKTGAYSTTEEILEKYRDTHPIVGLILDIRGLRKLLATYINALPALVNPKTGRIHTSYNQTVTATGRISSTNPNLQNIPVRTDDGREIRRAFIPAPANVMLSADYSQIELRLMAEMSGDETMIEAFDSGADIHRATAAKIYHEPIDRVSDRQRRNAKTANFGIIYGISAFGLSERLKIPRSEAQELIAGYFRTYPKVKEYMDRSIEVARRQQYVETLMGRRRMLSDINSRNAVVRGYAERNAINAPLQGSAADIIKKAMVDIYRELTERCLNTKMIMQVHDELIFDVDPRELEQVKEIVARNMENAYRGRVRLEVSMGVGENWLQAH